MWGGANPAYGKPFLLLQRSRLRGSSMKQYFPSVEERLRQSSIELIRQMAEIQKLRLAVKQAESKNRRTSSLRAPTIGNGLIQPQAELA